MTRIRRVLSLSVLLAMTACGGIPTKKFEFDAMDVNEQPRPCLVVVEGDWVAAAEKNQYVNVNDDDVLTLDLPFRASEIEITMAPVIVENGKVTRVPKSRKEASDYSGFVDESRRLLITDPKRQLFFLRRKSGSS